MAAPTDVLDLAALRLSPGEGRKLALDVRLREIDLGGQRFVPETASTTVTLNVSCMLGNAYALRLRLSVRLRGPCMRCLEEAVPSVVVDTREVDQPGGGEELDSPYVEHSRLDLEAWVHDAIVLELPAQPICREDCAGLCPVCAENLNRAGPDHRHDRAPDPRWAKLRELM